MSGNPTQEEVFRSLTQNMESEPDYMKILPWLFLVAGLVAVAMFIRQRQKKAAVAQALNHPGKLLREIMKIADLDALEMKELKVLAREHECQSPLTLLLCPSLLNSRPDPASPQTAAEPRATS